jgi:hypothetical protein
MRIQNVLYLKTIYPNYLANTQQKRGICLMTFLPVRDSTQHCRLYKLRLFIYLPKNGDYIVPNLKGLSRLDLHKNCMIE